MTLARLAGFDSIRITQIWPLGATEPTADDVTAVSERRHRGGPLRDARLRDRDAVRLEDDAARQRGADAVRAVRRRRSRRRSRRSSDVIVGNEPNLNRFWLPQFNPDGTDAAAPAYESLLAGTYDALKAVSPEIQVYGGAVSPRGGDKPGDRAGDALPHRLHQGHGSRLPGERPHRADHGRLRAARVRGRLVASRRARSTRRRRRSRSPTTTSSSSCSAPRSTAPPSPARPCRSSTASSGSSRRSRRRRRSSTRAPSRRPPSRSTRRRRPSTTARRSSSRSASRT